LKNAKIIRIRRGLFKIENVASGGTVCHFLRIFGSLSGNSSLFYDSLIGAGLFFIWRVRSVNRPFILRKRLFTLLTIGTTNFHIETLFTKETPSCVDPKCSSEKEVELIRDLDHSRAES